MASRRTCPSCGGELEPQNKDRQCDACRDPCGKIVELWAAFECLRKYVQPIPYRLLNGDWVKLELAGHELARREDRHEEYKAACQTGKLEFLIRWAMGKHGISRNDCFKMRVEDFRQTIEQIDPPQIHIGERKASSKSKRGAPGLSKSQEIEHYRIMAVVRSNEQEGKPRTEQQLAEDLEISVEALQRAKDRDRKRKQSREKKRRNKSAE